MLILEPLGDQAVLVALPGAAEALHLARCIENAAPVWLEDVVPAYRKVGIHFDANRITVNTVCEWVMALETTHHAVSTTPGPLHRIPVCYGFALDLERVASLIHTTSERIIELHTATPFTVYAIGFQPGFPYLGDLPEAFAAVSRLPTPRVSVTPGSVGIAGRQTGLYPSASPGGWNLIGRTPLTVVDVGSDFFPIRIGDRVQFERIDGSTFRQLEGQRLPRPTPAERVH